MIYNNRNLSAGERIRLHVALESEDPYCLPAGEPDPKPRRYPPEPALDVPRGTNDDSELSVHHERLSHETVLDYRLSRQLSATHHRDAKARRRELVNRWCWVAVWTLLIAVASVGALWVGNLIGEAVS